MSLFIITIHPCDYDAIKNAGNWQEMAEMPESCLLLKVENGLRPKKSVFSS